MSAVLDVCPPVFKAKRRVVGTNHSGNSAPRGRWPLEYKLLIYRVYESFLGPYGAAGNRAIAARAPTKEVIAKLKFAAPDMYDWWMDNHPDSDVSFDEWVRTTVYSRYFYMYTDVKTREAGVSSEHPYRWASYIGDTAEWREISAWVDERLTIGAPPEVQL
ncbi:MAG: hypothetical protein EON54_14395 [Alcaligenaceae bacterium]|nr:MAG: hypothetical protein EON54_14395 [Alcaligenaceae bacterium]